LVRGVALAACACCRAATAAYGDGLNAGALAEDAGLATGTAAFLAAEATGPCTATHNTPIAIATFKALYPPT